MWVNNEQRDRIFKMIGSEGAPHRVPSARLELQRLSLLIVLAALIGLGIALLAF
jgi:hypothetical protein